MTNWFTSTQKPEQFQNVLAVTNDCVLVEACWTGKSWFSEFFRCEIKCKFWRNLPKFENLYLEISDIPITSDGRLYKRKKMRRMRRVKYDETGRMHTLKELHET